MVSNADGQKHIGVYLAASMEGRKLGQMLSLGVCLLEGDPMPLHGRDLTCMLAKSRASICSLQREAQVASASRWRHLHSMTSISYAC